MSRVDVAARHAVDNALAPAAAVLDRRRVYIFLTRAGVTLGAMDFVILLGAINYDNALAYALAFMLGSLLLVAMLHTYRNLAGLAHTGVQALPVFVGEDAVFHCHFRHGDTRPRLKLEVGQWPRGLGRDARRQQERLQTECNVPPGEGGSAAVRVSALARGWLALARIRVQSVYPLGLLRAWAYFDSPAVCLVYPAPRGFLPLPRAPHGRDGGQATVTHGQDEFAGLRPYAPGDPLRAIAWKSLARERDLMVKRFQGQGRERVTLAFDATASLTHLEARLAQLCKWVIEASQAGLVYALELPDARVDFGHGAAHRAECLRAIALFGLDG